jgi:spore maturation protein CgeB
MRIFCAIRHSANPNFYYGDLWARNFCVALREMGHDVVEAETDLLPASHFMQIASGFTPEELETRARITSGLLGELRIAHRHAPVDLFLSYFYNCHFDPAGFDDVRSLGIPSVNFYCNSLYQFDLVAAVAAKADFAWHSEKNARPLYLSAGANPIWIQMGADPQTYRPIPDLPRLRSACFVGQRYADRDRLVAALIRASVPVELYGSGWGTADESVRSALPEVPTGETVYLGRKRLSPGSWQSYVQVARRNMRRGFIPGILRSMRQIQYRRETRNLMPLFAANARGRAEEISAVFARHEICLNFSNVWDDGQAGTRLIPHVRLRDFEGPMCRTCYITGHTEEIAEFYEIGREIETYASSEELVDKVRFYLNHSAAAEKLREAGYRRAVTDHTWQQRFQELFRRIGVQRGN